MYGLKEINGKYFGFKVGLVTSRLPGKPRYL
jgi:hypothetical protein